MPYFQIYVRTKRKISSTYLIFALISRNVIVESGLGKRFEWKSFELTKYLFKLICLVKIINSDIVNVKGLANENFVQINLFENIKIYPYSKLFPLKTFS